MHDLEEREIYNTSPTMVFSVIGDSDSFVPRPWPTTVFQTALIEAAKSGGGMTVNAYQNKIKIYTNVKLQNNIMKYQKRSRVCSDILNQKKKVRVFFFISANVTNYYKLT